MKNIKSILFRSPLLFVALLFSLRLEGEIPPDQKTMNFVFIGNSFTMRHKLPDIVKSLLEEGNPGIPVKTEIVGYGGRNLFQHWELFRSYNRLKLSTLNQAAWDSEVRELKALSELKDPPAFYTDYYQSRSEDPFFSKTYTTKKLGDWEDDRKMISGALYKHSEWKKTSNNDEKIDYLVLQSWQDETSSNETGYLKYAAKFAELATQTGVKPVFYLTAPHSQNEAPVTAAVKKDQTLNTCRTVNTEAKKWNAIVVPVPLALMLVQESQEPIARTLTFRYKSDFHPNNTMAYLTACTFYAALTSQSPHGLKFNQVTETKSQNIHGEAINKTNQSEAISSAVGPDGEPLETIFNDETRLFLQRIAWEAVEKFNHGEF